MSDPFIGPASVAGLALAEDAELAAVTAVTASEIQWTTRFLPAPDPAGERSSWSARPRPDVVAAPELATLADGVRRRVLQALVARADACGANLVIGVTRIVTPVNPAFIARAVGTVQEPSFVRAPFFAAPLELQLRGSAMRDLAQPNRATRLCSLDVDDFLKLTRGGWEPVGVIGGAGYQIAATDFSGVGAHELPAISAAFTFARAAAIAEMEHEAHELGADGVVDLRIETDRRAFTWYTKPGMAQWPRTGLMVGVRVLATAIRRSDPVARPLSPMRIVPVS